MRNNNKKIIRRLSGQSLKKNKMRNIFAVTAIALTALLFTTLFSLYAGVLQITQEQTMRQIGTRAHAGLKNVTMEQYKRITSHPLVKDHSYNIMIGIADNAKLVKRQTEIRYTQEKDLSFGFIRLKEGRLPEKENEIVVDTVVLDLLGVPRELGAEVTFRYSFMGQEREDAFTVSGWYAGDMVSRASQVYLSRAFWDKLSKNYTDQDFIKGYKTYLIGAGLIQGDLIFANSRNIEENMVTAITENGYSAEEIEYGINWAYYSEALGKEDPFSIVMIIVVFFIIMLTGYLIIYNIFQISIIGDIRYYGLLKTVGATRGQIRRLVLRQAVLLSCLGIPIGLLLGYSVANVSVPVLLSAGNSGMSTADFHLNPNPYIILFAVLFSLVTVWISCRKPGKIAGSVSPVEAAKYCEVNSVRMAKKKSTRGARLSRMALSNLRRDVKKTVFTILSLSLSMILLLQVITFSKSFSMDLYLETMLTGDFMINSVALSNHRSEAGLKLPEDFYEAANAQEGIESSARMYTTEHNVTHALTEEGRRRFEEFYEEGLLSVYETEQYTNLPMIQGVINQNDPIEELRYAYDEKLLEKLTVLEGEIDPEKFRSGRYILVAVYPDMTETFYHPGDKVKLNYHTPDSVQEMRCDEEGNYKQYVWKNDCSEEYEVMAVVDIPGSLTRRSYIWNSLTTIVPVEEFLAKDSDAICFNASYWIEDDKEAAFQSFVENYSTRVDPNTNYESKETLRKDLSGMNGAINLVGGALSFIVGMIGILNFVNTMLTGVITRKRELAMLQSIGLTDTQMKRMLFYEGLCYIAFTAIISITAGSLLSLSAVRALKNVVAYFDYQFTLLPFVVMLPGFLLIGLLVPEIAYRRAKKQSIIERLREAEG
jgi:putative ABC transport system permease protein